MSMQYLRDVIKEVQWKPGSSSGKYIEKIEKRIGKWLPAGQAVTLTALQRKALNHPLFFEKRYNSDLLPHNLIIQGATSAGKTLVSEISIIDELENHGRKAIVLVPLKAMVRERAEQLAMDLNIGNEHRVYGSSSDYLDHDEHIINGEFEVAVIVYEKYFAFLSQGSNGILNNCGLLIVDELSMLSREDRGPKLEMALEITRSQNPGTRIMCLATSDCKVEKIADWLDAGKEGIIRCPLRPISLDEHIIRTDGTGQKRHIPSELECDEDTLNASPVDELYPPEDIHVEIAGYNRDMREHEKKEKLLMSVIRSVYQRNPEAKILVFVATKADTKRYSKFLVENASDLFQPVSMDTDTAYQETMMAIDACDLDEDRSTIKELMRRGIAYHNSGVSTNLREIIESEFERIGSPVKAIVATETLTVGVNMPFDVMIMMDSKVPKGRGDKVPLTNQEYRNYIGRAGRLGLSGGMTETYLFASDDREFNTYWKGYYQDDEEIASALTGTPEASKAPYYLSLLKSRKVVRFLVGDIDSLYRKSLAYTFERQRGIEFNASTMLKALKRAELVNDAPVDLALVDNDETYMLTRFGRQIAPFALSMATSSLIYVYFVQGARGYGLPAGISQKDIDDDRYLLEILFHICRDEEVNGTSNIPYPSASGGVQIGNPMIIIRRALNDIMQETVADGTPKHKLWSEDTRYKGIYRVWKADMNDLDPEEEMKPAMRAILIYYWTQGLDFGDIMERTKFREFLRNIAAGDLERLAEVISFHLDAIYNSLIDFERRGTGDNPSNQIVLEDPSSFYSLQTRVKYGMARDLVTLANKHVHGLDRAKLLKFGKLAMSRNQSPQELLFDLQPSAIRSFMTIKQRNVLIQRIEQRFSGDKTDFDTLCNILLSEQPGETTEQFVHGLQEITDWDGKDVNGFYQILSSAFSRIRKSGSLNPARSTRGVFDRIIWNLEIRDEQHTVTLAVIGANAGREIWERGIDHLNSQNVSGRVLIVHADKEMEEEDRSNQVGMLREYGHGYDIALSNRTFATVLFQAYKEQNQAAYVLYQFLTDAYGVFIDVPRVSLSMQNYLPRKYDEENSEKRYYLLASHFDGCYGGKNITDIKNGLADNDENACCVLPWGDELVRAIEDQCFFRNLALIYLNRDDIIHSKSLTKFMYHMADQHYENCYALFGSESMRQAWYDQQSGEGHVLQWKSTNNQIRSLSADHLQEVSQRVNSYRPDGWQIAISYAHYDASAPAEIHDPETTSRDAIAKLNQLYDALVNEFGVHRVFYDKDPEDQAVFAQAEAKRHSLSIYRHCRFGLFLCNYWTIHNNNCRSEREEVKKRYREGLASYLYLTARGSDACPPDDPNEYPVDISDTETIIAAIHRFL